QQGKSLFSDSRVGKPSGELPFEGCTVAKGKLVHHHPADVVPIPLVLVPWIAEPDDEEIERRGGCASTEERQSYSSESVSAEPVGSSDAAAPAPSASPSAPSSPSASSASSSS